MNPIFRVGALLITGVILVIAPYRASGQSGAAGSPSNIECVEHLEIPNYPPLARQANIQVIQTVTVLLSDQAAVQNVEQSLQGTVVKLDRLFKGSAEKALKNSGFSKTCGGKTITLVFHYEIRTDSNGSPFAFGPPNHFWIRAGPVYVNP